ncbi:hypothetical protein ANCDUO_09035 [Ancylostoma duodenale]|uniref:Uncharacterized protein n=1 Tax=Ancylostoma duodenale TaxID=51022 RepID=A0A0C2CUW9_9BILA|nr:hypothetical protein ANCDUO_09035 [Ancylostoma duodenale]
MKLIPEKCPFFQKEVQYLGALVSKNGTRLNPDTVASIVNIKRPTDSKAVKISIAPSVLLSVKFTSVWTRAYCKLIRKLVTNIQLHIVAAR